MVVEISLLVFLFIATPPVQGLPQKSFGQIVQQADAARVADRTNDAIALYSEGVRLRPSWSEGWWSLGSLLYDQDRFSEAESSLKRFIAIAPKPAPAYAFLALCEYETHEYDHALQHFQAWAREGSPGTDELIDVAGFHWALLLTRGGRFPQALYLLDAKAQKLGGTPALIEAMGLASLRMPSLPEDYPAQQRELVWLAGKAAYYASAHEPYRTQEYANRLLTRYGGQPNVHYFRGTLFAFEKDRSAEAEEYEQELKISPQHVPAMVELALVRVYQERSAEAVPLAERAAALEPKNSRAHYALGWGLVDTGRPQEGARELERAKQLAPDSAAIRFILAKAYRTLGQKEQAKRESAAFLALKDKQEVLAYSQEKTRMPKQSGPPKQQ